MLVASWRRSLKVHFFLPQCVPVALGVCFLIGVPFLLPLLFPSPATSLAGSFGCCRGTVRLGVTKESYCAFFAPLARLCFCCVSRAARCLVCLSVASCPLLYSPIVCWTQSMHASSSLSLLTAPSWRAVRFTIRAGCKTQPSKNVPYVLCCSSFLFPRLFSGVVAARHFNSASLALSRLCSLAVLSALCLPEHLLTLIALVAKLFFCAPCFHFVWYHAFGPLILRPN
ncbi:hypothetical protein TRVL_08173 [Trypanosoma vivax]|nr:hypothetical protein TRVL_08173 [Trypanosoma vivax]